MYFTRLGISELHSSFVWSVFLHGHFNFYYCSLGERGVGLNEGQFYFTTKLNAKCYLRMIISVVKSKTLPIFSFFSPSSAFPVSLAQTAVGSPTWSTQCSSCLDTELKKSDPKSCPFWFTALMNTRISRAALWRCTSRRLSIR